MIAEMARVEIVGPRRLLPEVLAYLQRAGTLHLRPCPTPLAEWAAGVPVDRSDPEVEARLAAAAERLGELERVLPLAPAADLPGEGLPDPAADGFLDRVEALATELRALDERRAGLEEERLVLRRYEQLLVAIAPLLNQLDGAEQVETIGVLLRRNEPEAIALLEEAVARTTGGAYTLVCRPIDAEQLGGFLAVPKRFAPAVGQLLFERGVGEVKLPSRYAGRRFADAVRMLVSRRQEIAGEIEACEGARRAFARRWRAPIAAARRDARDRLARLKARSLCAETNHAFVVAGWVPAARLPALTRELDERHAGAVAVFPTPIGREDWGEVPVVLENPRWLQPFELLLALQPLPRYGSVDPTPYLAIFFPLFFGLILGDVGHGVLGLGIALVARRRGWGGELGRNIAVIAIACSISAIVFGVLFGELFGELGPMVGLDPILFDRKHDLVPLLLLVVAVGAGHIALGLLLGALAAWRRREVKTAVARLCTVALIVDGAVGVGAAFGPLPDVLADLAPWLAAPFVASAVILEGPLGLLELVQTGGAILSYARLMAVGVASVMFAAAANRLGEVLRPAAVGIALAVFLHAVNFTLGLLSPAIQALRLQYVEFFDKFFVPGGRAYQPFSLGPQGG